MLPEQGGPFWRRFFHRLLSCQNSKVLFFCRVSGHIQYISVVNFLASSTVMGLPPPCPGPRTPFHISSAIKHLLRKQLMLQSYICSCESEVCAGCCRVRGLLPWEISVFVKTLECDPAYQSIPLPLVQRAREAGDKLKRWRSGCGEDGGLNLVVNIKERKT